jgi:hypothetical protein
MSLRENSLSSVVRKSPLRGLSVGHESEPRIPKLLLRKTSHIRSMLCTECIQKKEVPAEIERLSETEKPAEIKTFIDPDGHEHIHDMSMVVIEYTCSNNHKWSIKESKNKCWCLHYQSSPLASSSYSPRSNEPILVSPRRTVYPKGESFISFPVDESSESDEPSPKSTSPKSPTSKSCDPVPPEPNIRQSPNRRQSSHN